MRLGACTRSWRSWRRRCRRAEAAAAAPATRTWARRPPRSRRSRSSRRSAAARMDELAPSVPAGPGARAVGLAAHARQEPLRLRPLRPLAQADHRRARRDLHRALARPKALAARTSRAGSRSTSRATTCRRRSPPTPTRRRRSTSPTCRSRSPASTSCSACSGSTTAWSAPGTTVKVVKGSNVPDGRRSTAPKMHTPTKDSVGGDLSKIDTRDPHDDMHDVNFADALGKQPDRPAVRNAGALPEPRLRAGRRHRRAGQARAPEGRRRLDPPGDLQQQQAERRLPPAVPEATTCRASRGCSRSTATARSPRGSRAPTAPTSSRRRSTPP